MMEIVIKIPKEFENHFNSDRFEDSLARVASDIESFGFELAGRYEKETIIMLRKALKDSVIIPKGHGRLIDEEQISGDGGWDFSDRLMLTPTIIEADKESEDE
jgi:hypothetical protein